MAAPGQVIRNAVTGETTTFLVTAADSAGALLEVDVQIDPKAAGGDVHLHPRIRETHELLEGALHFELEGIETTVEAGQRLEIPPGTAHSFWNADDRRARTRVRYEPAGTFERFMETYYALAGDGKLDAKGRPTLLQAALIGRRHIGDIALARPPVLLQRLLYGALAPLARARGYRDRYPP